MYDSVNTTLSSDEVKGVQFLEYVPQFLSNCSKTTAENYGCSIIGYIENVKVKVTENDLRTYGSLSKFFVGNNQYTMTCTDSKLAVEKLCDTLHLPMDKASATRIDFTDNLNMLYTPPTYYPFLGEKTYSRRNQQDNGLYYNGAKQTLFFYGKETEQKRKRIKVIPQLINSCSLRYEYRLTKQINKQLNMFKVDLGSFHKPNFYNLLLEKWKEEYFKIKKINKLMSTLILTGSVKKDMDLMFAMMMKDNNSYLHLLDIVTQSQKGGLITKEQSKRYKDKFRGLNNIGDFDNSLIDELDNKVLETVEKFKE